jgi:anti-sigma-K factor RskA
VNLKEYIASGIIESYVMGLASESERAEFEQLCKQHPELVAERRKFEESLEAYASEQAVRPPAGVKAKILEAIGDPDLVSPSSSNPSKRIITMENSKSPRSTGMLRFAAAAAVILLLGMVVLYYQISQQNRELVNANNELTKRVTEDEAVIDKIKIDNSIIDNPNAIVVNMVGTKVPVSSANVYWDSTNSSVYLVVKNMPKLPSNQQYQLWALIDNKKKNLGVFDATDNNVILKMDSTKKAQAFAITIEKKGGNPTPTLDSLQSIGKTRLTQ